MRDHSGLSGSRSIWAIGLLVALLSWPLGIGTPAAGLDSSWLAGLYMAAHDGKAFGSEIVFTYGPLGFLSWPQLWFGWLAVLAYLYASVLYLAFVLTLTWALRQSIGLPGAALVTFAYLVTLPDFGFEIPAVDPPMLLAVGWSFAALRADRSPAAVRLLAVGGGAICAIALLVKLSIGPPTVVICVLGLLGARARRRDWSLFGVSAVGGLIALWLLARQPLGGLWDYAHHSVEIVSGYSEAMGLNVAPAWQGAVLLAFAVILVASVTLAQYRDLRARLCATALVAVAAFVTFKYGITQFHTAPVSVALATLMAIFLMAPWPRNRAALFLTATAILGAVAVHVYPTDPRLDPLENLRRFKASAELAARPGLRERRSDEARLAMQSSFAVDPGILEAIEGRSVTIDPWEISVAWAYGLDWSPLPVFQNYAAYTSELDRLNAAEVEDPRGPEVILRHDPGGTQPLGGRRSFRDRLPAWDPPAQNLATVCNFEPTVTAGAWQVLSRVPNRCGQPTLIGSRSAEPGQTIAVPRAGRNELVVLRLEGAEVDGLDRLRTTLWRAPPRFATLNDDLVTYQLVPGTSGDGLVVSRDPALDGKGGFAQLPAVENMRVTGVDNPLRFDFYRVRVVARPSRGTT